MRGVEQLEPAVSMLGGPTILEIPAGQFPQPASMRILRQIMQERPWPKHQFQTPRCLCYLGKTHAYLVELPVKAFLYRLCSIYLTSS